MEVPFNVPGPLVPGTYSGAIGSGQWTISVPAGWEWFYDILWSDLGLPGTYRDVGGPGEVALGWWPVASVFADPCHWQDSVTDPPHGSTVDDLATALAEQVGRQGVVTDVVLAGLPTKKVESSVPADLELATCDKGVYRQFLGPGESLDLEPSELTSALAPSTSQPDVLYVLDLAGSPWVLWTWHDADSSAQDMAELDVMLGSIRIASPAPAAPSPLN